MNDIEERQFLEEIAALQRAIAARDHALLSLTQRMDQVIETIQADRDRLDRAVTREQRLSQFVRQILVSIQDVLIVTDQDGAIVQTNIAAHRQLGFRPEALMGMVIDALLPTTVWAAYEQGLPASRTVSASVWVEMIAKRAGYLEELDLLGGDGAVAGTFRVSAELFYNPQGKFEGVVMTASDFTQRKKAEQALAESEARLQRILDGSPVPLFVIDQEHRLTHWNRACEALTGMPAAEMVGAHDYWRAFYDAPHPCLLDLALDHANTAEIAQHYPNGVQERELTGRILEWEGYVPKLGKWLFLTAAPIRDSQDRTVAAMESIQDMTERNQHEQALRLAANVFEHAREGIIITDVDGTILDVNRAFEDITGYSHEEAISRNPRFLQSGYHDAAFYAEMWQTLAKRGYWHSEIWNRRKNGAVYPQSTSISAVRNADGQVTCYVGLFADISLLKESQMRLEQMAYYDPLTGLPNRALLADRLRLMLAKAQRDQGVFAVCYLDLDNFKPVNDCWGHTAGDELLVQVAQRFQQSVRGEDTVARLGGDEFVILLNNLSSIEEGERILERILAALSAPLSLKAAVVTVSASIGVTFFPHDGADPDALIRHADQAMYRAKQGGRNCYHLFDLERDRQARTQRELLERIRQGWGSGEFCLYYQPKVNMRQGQAIGVEALARWRHPDQGVLAPAAFIEIVESSDFAPVFSDWVLETAIQNMAAWRQAGLTLPVSVNLSARCLQQPDFAVRLRSLLARYSYVHPEWLEIEVLETTALEETQRVFQIIAECRRLGVRFAIDDFGAGYSSLTYLKQLPAQTLKIDRSFVQDMLFDPGDLAIVRGIVGLTTAFRLDVIAEGVESVEHGVLLMQLGCDCAQGYAISRPMPAEALADWVRHWRKPEAWNFPPPLAREGG